MKLSLSHLSVAEHQELARLLSRVQDDLRATTAIVQRAPFTDRVLRCQKSVQESLIDELLFAWDAANPERWKEQPYPSVYYATRRAPRRRRVAA
jgi:hypothetical protein